MCWSVIFLFSFLDVLLHIDQNNQLQRIPDEISNRKLFTGCITPPSTSGHWLLFVIGNKLHYTSDNQLIGEQSCKLRQLKLLGYSPIVVSKKKYINNI